MNGMSTKSVALRIRRDGWIAHAEEAEAVAYRIIHNPHFRRIYMLKGLGKAIAAVDKEIGSIRSTGGDYDVSSLLRR
jgi:hypothetical protein